MAMSAPETLVGQPSLVSLAVFHRDLGPKDEDAGTSEMAEKILFFHPPMTPLPDQVNRIQLAEGMLDFVSVFTPGSFHYVRQEQTMHFFVEPEPGLWITVVAAGTTTSRSVGRSKVRAQFGLDDRPAPLTVFHTIVRAVLRDAHQVYSLFYGSVNRIVRSDPCQATLAELHGLRKRVRKGEKARAELRRRSSVASESMMDGMESPRPTMAQSTLDKIAALPKVKQELAEVEASSPLLHVRASMGAFMSAWLSQVDFSCLTLLHEMDGFHYLPVDRASYLKLQYFVNSVMLSLDALHHGIFLYDGRLLFTTLPHGSVRVVLKYLRMHCDSVLRDPKDKARCPAFSVPPPLVATAVRCGTTSGFMQVPKTLTALRHAPVHLSPRGVAQTPVAAKSTDPSQRREWAHLGPRQSKDGPMLFAPPVYLDPQSDRPTHYMTWYQHGRVTMLMFADYRTVNGVPKGMPAPPVDGSASPVGSTRRGGSGAGAGAGAGGGRATDDRTPSALSTRRRADSAAVRDLRLLGLCDAVLGLITEAVPPLVKAIAAAQERADTARSNIPKDIARLLYFNTINGALKFMGQWPGKLGDRRSTMLRGSKKPQSDIVSASDLVDAVPSGLMVVLNNTRQLFSRSDTSVEERIVRTRRYGNVLARKAFGRELYFVVDVKTVGIVESYGKTQDVLNTKFVNICMD